MGSFGECIHLPGFMLYADVGGYNNSINALALPFEASAAYANAPTFVGLDDAPGATVTLLV